MKLSIIIPCYNEEKNIPLIFERLQGCIQDKTNIEVVLVNNGSTDNTKEVLENILQVNNNTNFVVCDVPVNQGYGYGIMQGLNQATGDILSWTHADMQTDPQDVITAFNQFYTDGYIDNFIVKGKRKNRRLIEAFFTFGMQIIAFLYLKKYMDDINAQPKMFSRAFFESYLKNKAPNDFSLDLFLLYTALNNSYSIKTIPVFFNKRIHGEAKGGGSFKTRIKLIKRTFAYIKELSKSLHN